MIDADDYLRIIKDVLETDDTPQESGERLDVDMQSMQDAAQEQRGAAEGMPGMFTGQTMLAFVAGIDAERERAGEANSLAADVLAELDSLPTTEPVSE